MILKNVDKILHQPIITKDGNLWFAKDVIVTMDDDVAYEFKLVTQVPVRSSPTQQYYHMTKTLDYTATLRLFGTTYELFCGGQVWRGYCTDIDTIDKFILLLADMLPNY
jgi:hypothetical protein